MAPQIAEYIQNNKDKIIKILQKRLLKANPEKNNY